jgi:peptide deformylase
VQNVTLLIDRGRSRSALRGFLIGEKIRMIMACVLLVPQRPVHPSLMPPIQLVIFPHPVLAQKAKPIVRVDAGLHAIVSRMFEIMYEHRGVGLAANQVGIPLRLFVANESGEKGKGEEMVFINPVLSKHKGLEESEEGCLSLPGIRSMVKRSKSLWVNAYNAKGQEINQEFSGFVARIIQHESDHLDGVLFTDRLSEETRRQLDFSLRSLEMDFLRQQSMGSIPSSEILSANAKEWEKKYS